jgi:hypothetical protein
MSVPFPTSSSLSKHGFRVVGVEISQDLAALGITHDRARRYSHDEVTTVLSMLVFSPTVSTRLSAEVPLVGKVEQGAELGIDTKDDAAAISAIATSRSASGPVLLPQEADTSPAPVSSFYRGADFVDEMHIRKKSPLWGLRKGRYDALRRAGKTLPLQKKLLGRYRFLRLGEINADPFTIFSYPIVPDNAINLREDGIVAPHANIYAWVDTGAELTDYDVARPDGLPGIDLYPAPLTRTITAVAT